MGLRLTSGMPSRYLPEADWIAPQFESWHSLRQTAWASLLFFPLDHTWVNSRHPLLYYFKSQHSRFFSLLTAATNPLYTVALEAVFGSFLTSLCLEQRNKGRGGWSNLYTVYLKAVMAVCKPKHTAMGIIWLEKTAGWVSSMTIFFLMYSKGKEVQNLHIMQTTKIVKNVLMRIKCW